MFLSAVKSTPVLVIHAYTCGKYLPHPQTAFHGRVELGAKEQLGVPSCILQRLHDSQTIFNGASHAEISPAPLTSRRLHRCCPTLER